MKIKCLISILFFALCTACKGLPLPPGVTYISTPIHQTTPLLMGDSDLPPGEKIGLTIFAILLLIMFLGGFAFILDLFTGGDLMLRLTKRNSKQSKQVIEHDLLPESSLQSKSITNSKLERILAEKKERLLGIPNVSFHFVDREQVQSFYNDYFKEPTIDSLVSEITGEISSQVKGSIPKIVEAKVGGKDINKWISKMKLPDISLNGMFVRYQRETIKSDQVTLGLEEIDIELSELQAFDDSIQELEERFQFVIGEELLRTKRLSLKEKAAERTLQKLELASGWVLIEGKFRIEKQEGFYKLIYSHPVNDFIANPATKVTISTSIPIENIEDQFTGNYAQSIGGMIPIRIYGQIWQPIDRSVNIWNLQLTPLSIY
jgi:hypothetical protein